MTTKQFLLYKERNWIRIEAIQEQMRRNDKRIKELIESNQKLYDQAKKIVKNMQKKAQEIDNKTIKEGE